MKQWKHFLKACLYKNVFSCFLKESVEFVQRKDSGREFHNLVPVPEKPDPHVFWTQYMGPRVTSDLSDR